MAWRAHLVALVALAACSQGAGRRDGATVGAVRGRADDSACLPERLGLAGARRAASYTVPQGCVLTTQPAQGELVRVASEEEFRARYQCPAGTASGIDFAASELRIMARMMSPANVGIDVWDDGTKLTMVDRFREPCQASPMPMPMISAFQFLLPAGATRTTATASCTIRPDCD